MNNDLNDFVLDNATYNCPCVRTGLSRDLTFKMSVFAPCLLSWNKKGVMETEFAEA